MKKSLVLAILSLVFASNTVRAQAPTAHAERITIIRAGVLIDGTGGTPRKNQLIFVRGNRIEKVADAGGQIPAGAAVIDLSSATVLPGLIDSHTHIFLWGEDPAKGGYDENILKAGIALRAPRAQFPPPAATTWRVTRRNWTCPRARSLWMVRWKRAKPRGNSSSTARTGSRCT